MRLSALDALDSFALLAPGYGREWRLLSPLVPGGGRVLFATYEEPAPAAYEGDALPFDGIDVPPARLEPVLDARGYEARVERIRAAIARGDVYQVNLTLRARFACPPGARLFAALVRRGVPDYAAWVRFPGGREVVSASPELLFGIAGRRVWSEPMKGTAPAGGADGLRASAKDEAELAMITDLVRHDLAPVCRPRSVRVVEERRLVHLPYAVQAVSLVEGTLADGAGAVDVFAALHPGGSVTGTPKNAARAMISALEPEERGAYCGALCLTGGDQARCALLIRTASRPDRAAEWVYGAGGAIVWQSDPRAELAEIRVKMGALS